MGEEKNTEGRISGMKRERKQEGQRGGTCRAAPQALLGHCLKEGAVCKGRGPNFANDQNSRTSPTSPSMRHGTQSTVMSTGTIKGDRQHTTKSLKDRNTKGDKGGN